MMGEFTAGTAYAKALGLEHASHIHKLPRRQVEAEQGEYSKGQATCQRLTVNKMMPLTWEDIVWLGLP